MTKYGEQRDSPAIAASTVTAPKRFLTPGRYNYDYNDDDDDDDNDFFCSLSLTRFKRVCVCRV